jgi:class 3 adenylate cyclase/tetratricopeptide (TPR) repeat protein
MVSVPAIVYDRCVIRCARCSLENPAEAQFCMRCGEALSRRCRACGAANSLEAQFCIQCGTPLEGMTSTERRVLSVLFADLVGSTRLTERTDPERMRAIIQEYFATMRAEIERHGGVVEKFIGDAVMAVFGLPTAHEDDPERAVRAAVLMQRRMPDLNAGLQADLRMRIGVSTGEVVADPAAVATGQFMVTGDVVNLAARLQEDAQPGGVLIDDRTHNTTQRLGEFRLLRGGAGRRDGTRWEVLALAEPSRRDAEGRAVPGLRSAIVGRDDEVQFLQALYRRVVDGRRQHLVTVIGAAGVGKSRLVEEFTRALDRDAPPPRVLRGRCPAYGEGLTYWPLAEMLKQECGIKNNDPPHTVSEKFRAGILRICEPLTGTEDADAIVAGLAPALGVDTPLRGTLLPEPGAPAPRDTRTGPMGLRDPGATGPRRGSESLAQAVRGVLVAMTRSRPLVLIFEDLQWAEESMLELLEHPSVRTVEAPILTICLARPELFERQPDWGARIRNYTALSLSPLPLADGRLLISALLHDVVVPSDMSEAILAKAEGIPLFIEEIVRMLIERGNLVGGDHGWEWASVPLKIRIPDTIRGILAARLDLLTPLEKRVIQDASVPGRVFWGGAVTALGGLGPAEVSAALERLVERELVDERPASSMTGEREFIFKHAFIQEVAYRMLPKSSRSIRHRRFAEWLEQSTAENAEKFLEILAHHYEDAWRYEFEAGRDAAALARQAIDALRRAGQKATALRTLPEARRLYERALRILRNAELEGDVPLQIELRTDHAEVVKWMHAPDLVAEDTRVVLELAPQVGREDLVARAWLNRAFAEFDRDQLKPAEDALWSALELFRRLRDRQGEAEALEILGNITDSLRGSLSKAEAAYRKALDLYAAMGDGRGLARTTAWLGRVVLNEGRLADAGPLLADALQLARTHHERISEPASLLGLAILAHLKGDSGQAVHLYREVIALQPTLGDPVSETARRSLAMHYLRQRRPDEAERELQTALALAREHGATADSPYILRALAEVYLARGELLAAAAFAERAVADAPEGDAIAHATHGATLAAVRAAQGREEEAVGLFERSLSALEGREYRIDLGLVLWKYGEALLILAQPERAEDLLARARGLFADIGAPPFIDAIDAQIHSHRNTRHRDTRSRAKETS